MRNLSAALDASGGDLRWLLTTVTEVQARIRALEQSLALIKPRGPSQLALPVAPAAAEPAPAALDANGGLSGEELAALLDGLQEMQDRIRGLEEALARAESGNAGAPAPEAAPPSDAAGLDRAALDKLAAWVRSAVAGLTDRLDHMQHGVDDAAAGARQASSAAAQASSRCDAADAQIAALRAALDGKADRSALDAVLQGLLAPEPVRRGCSVTATVPATACASDCGHRR